jgi:hypothetical protein
MDDSKKTLDFCIQTANLTADVLRNVLFDWTMGKDSVESKGKIPYRKLIQNGKLDSIEITDNNIKDFMKVAKKYDVDYALKKDSSTTPPTYNVFFTAKDTDTFKRAFQEYAGKMDKKISKGQKHTVTQVVNRNQIKKNVKAITKKSRQQSKEKHKNQSDIPGR